MYIRGVVELAESGRHDVAPREVRIAIFYTYLFIYFQRMEIFFLAIVFILSQLTTNRIFFRHEIDFFHTFFIFFFFIFVYRGFNCFDHCRNNGFSTK